MADGRGSGERLPWLEPAPRIAPASSAAARRARTPLLLLLALLVGSGVAVMAFLAGRGTAPVQQASPLSATSVPATPAAPPWLKQAQPQSIPAVPPVPVRTPMPAAPLVTAKSPAAPAAPSALKQVAAKPTAPRRAVPATRPSVRVSQGVRVHRNAPRAQGYRWPAQATDRPSGRVVQLGAYRTPAEVGAAWRRLVRAYPYLARLPRRVAAVGPVAGRPRYYRLRIGARSTRAARGLCTELHRRGRGCIVV